MYRVEKVEKGTGEHKHDHNFPPKGHPLHLMRPVLFQMLFNFVILQCDQNFEVLRVAIFALPHFVPQVKFQTVFENEVGQ